MRCCGLALLSWVLLASGAWCDSGDSTGVVAGDYASYGIIAALLVNAIRPLFSKQEKESASRQAALLSLLTSNQAATEALVKESIALNRELIATHQDPRSTFSTVGMADRLDRLERAIDELSRKTG